MHSKETIEEQINSWATKNFGADFTFREHQLDTCSRIISNIVNNNEETEIIEAPTGSGKSIICLVCAGVLADFYDKTSYILCSDLYLWSQYEDFIYKYKLNFGILKGQTGNYTCSMNSQDIKLSSCKIQGISWPTLFDVKKAEARGFDCCEHCEYIIARKKAVRAKVTLMTYALYLYQMNVVPVNEYNIAGFKKRDVLFCDECHMIPDIISGFASPNINPTKQFPKFEELYNYCYNNGLLPEKYASITPNEYHKEITKAFNELWDEDNEDRIFEKFKRYVNAVSKFGHEDDIKDNLFPTMDKIQTNLSKVQHNILSDLDLFHNLRCYWSDFSEAISKCGKEYIVKDSNFTKHGGKSITVSCAKEDYLVYLYLLKNTTNCVMLSATVGNKDEFEDNIGIKFTESKKSEMWRVPSTFDFSCSPIVFYPTYKMGYKDIETNFPLVAEMAYRIISQYPNFNGMVHTSSYKNAKRFYESAPEDIKARLLCYSDNTEKEKIINTLQENNGKVLVGPTLTEGIDLPDDLCRLLIILKVNYPSLGSKYVKRKIELFPKWYDSAASRNLRQSIGRGNRGPNDWCHCYILDGCFGRLYSKTKDQYPEEFKNRIQVVR